TAQGSSRSGHFDFDLHAIGFDAHWLVVATESSTAAPLAGIRILQASDADGRRKQSAEGKVTDSAGLAILTAGSDWPLVVGQQGTRRAQLRLDRHVGSGEDEGVWMPDGPIETIEPAPAWWWFDRPAYSSGDTANVAIWLRSALTRPPEPASSERVRITAPGDDNDVRATLLADAGLAVGELTLPDREKRIGEGWDFTLNASGARSHLMVSSTNVGTWMRSPPKVELGLAEQTLIAGRKLSVRASARYADGSPATFQSLHLLARTIHSYDDPLARAYPGFRFRDPTSFAPHGGECSAAAWSAAGLTSASGDVDLALWLPSTCDAARLVLSAFVGLGAERAAAVTSPGWLYREPRQLGLSGWRSALPTGSAVFQLMALDLDQVQASAPGARLTALRVDGGPAERLQCRARADGRAPCRLNFKREGLYQLILEADGWPTRHFRQAVGEAFALPPGPAPMPALQLEQRWWAHGEPIRFWFRHDYQEARALLVLADERVRATQWLDVPDDQTSSFQWQPPTDAEGCYRLALLTLPVGGGVEALRSPRLNARTVCISPREPELLAWQMAATVPVGGKLTINLHSQSERPLRLMLRGADASWVDDGMANELPATLSVWLQMPNVSASPPSLRSSIHDGGQPRRIPRCGPEIRVCVENIGAMSLAWPSVIQWYSGKDSWPAPDAHGPAVLTWLPDLQLSPGEHRIIELPVPDHPAGWRLDLIAVDPAGGIQQLQQIVEAVPH
ncbi:MAG: hypothetical protein KDI56_16490, partial [Xanthomonadales bacterium]|nr:hypothetical protein [Xanthomonadales bacterium]